MLICKYCHTRQRKFYCTDCIKEKLQKHGEELNDILTERTAAISHAEAFVKRATSIQQLVAEKNKRAAGIKSIQQRQMKLTLELNRKKTKVKELQKQIREKQKALEDGFKRKSHYKQPFAASTVPDTSLMKAWQRTHKMTVGTRRILVREVTSLFELKPGVVEEVELTATTTTDLPKIGPSSAAAAAAEDDGMDIPPFSQTVAHIEAKEDLYICGVTLPTRLIDASKYPKEELNAPIGLVIHMLGLIVRYLGIKLPFLIFHRGVRPYIRMIPPNTSQLWDSYKKMPLFLEEDDKNFKRFVIGMAMLNYNLAYLCYTQNVKIPLSQVANTLQSLMACCRAPDLGLHSHSSCYQGLRDINFPLEFQQVLRATMLRYRCTSQQQQLQQQQPSQQHQHQQTVQGSMVSSSQSEEEYNDSNGLYGRHSQRRRRLRSHPLTYFLQQQQQQHEHVDASYHHEASSEYFLNVKKFKKRKSSAANASEPGKDNPDYHQALSKDLDIVSDDNAAGYNVEDGEEEDGSEVEYHYYLESEDDDDDDNEADVRERRQSKGKVAGYENEVASPSANSSPQQVRRSQPASVTVPETANSNKPATVIGLPKDNSEAWSIVEVAPSFYEHYRK